MSFTPLQAVQLVARAYDPALMADGTLPDLTGLGFKAVVDLWADDANGPACFGFLAVPLVGAGQIIVSRGTQTRVEWLEDGEIELVASPWKGGVGLVHRGFSALTATLGFGRGLSSLWTEIGPLNQLAVAGHSLGAADVRQLSMRLGHADQIFTWGEPRSCDSDSAGYALTCAGQTRRAVNPRDLVPKVPDFDLLRPLDPYNHVGPALELTPWGNPLDTSECHSIDLYVAAEVALAAGANPTGPTP
jgi:hypothetical protein